MMKSLLTPRKKLGRSLKQRGVVLFFALIALVVMSLAAVALIRSVDTSTMIAGNLASKQAATNSGDAGIENAIVWLAATETANSILNVYNDAPHPFNITNAANGYYSNADPALNLFANATWNAITALPPVIDSSGNTVSYIVQRMCRSANQLLSIQGCLFSAASLDKNGMEIRLPQQICDGPGCPKGGQAPLYRITARVTGQRNTVSYIQTFVF
jgi:type IV pilus assembly protein PilX